MVRSRSHCAGPPALLTALASLLLGGSLTAGQSAATIATPPSSGGSALLQDTSDLRLSTDDVAMLHGRALVRALRGDLEGALAELGPLAERAAQGAQREGVERDLVRLRAFSALRVAFLEELAATGGSLVLEQEGRKLRLPVARLEQERVVFASNRAGIEALPLAGLDSLQVASQIGREVAGKETGWTRTYPLVLAGDERWKTRLKRGHAADDALRADALDWYPALLRLGEAADRLAGLEQAGSPADAASASATLARIEALLSEHGDLAQIQQRLRGLEALASACLAQTFEPDEGLALLAGRSSRLENGLVRLTYEFDQPGELDDFADASGYPPERFSVLPELKTHAERSVVELAEGTLSVAGSRSWRHVLPFEGSITLRCRLQVDAAPAQGSPWTFWMLGACDDGRESYVALQELGTVLSIDKPSAVVTYSPVDPLQQLHKKVSYELELVFDGKTVRTKVNGAPVKEIPAAGQKRGSVFLVVHSDAPVEIERLEIEGTPVEVALRGLWVERGLDRIAGLRGVGDGDGSGAGGGGR